MKKPLFFFVFLLMLISVKGQKKSFQISFCANAPKIDGILNEEIWKSKPQSGFIQHYPTDSSKAKAQTLVWTAYDDKFIYIAANCLGQQPGDYVTQSLKRDFEALQNDHFAVYLDPFNDQVNGFVFAISPKGVMQEAAVQNGSDLDLNWDQIWYANAAIHADGYSIEMAIPFKSIRFKDNINAWGINFSRMTLKNLEQSTWAQVPIVYPAWTLSNTGTVQWEQPPKKQGPNIGIAPYALAGLNKDVSRTEPTEATANAGLDAKIVLTPSLNLDVTVNPDFSQIEVDQQQTNLSRFELFFPEKRTYFIENSDLFAKFGFRQIRPFFSRRIGLQRGAAIPIIAGARLSGKLNNKLRIGAMNMQTANYDDGIVQQDAQNYTVAAFQQQVFKRSNVGMIFVNRQSVINESISPNDYNRVVGIDYNIFSQNNKWRGKIFYHKSFDNNELSNSDAHASWIMRNTKKWFTMWNHEYVGKNYDAQVGYVPRNKRFDPIANARIRSGYWRLEPKVSRRFYPTNPKVVMNEFGWYANHYMDVNFNTSDYEIRFEFKQERNSTSEIRLQYTEAFTRLFYPRDVTFSGNLAHPVGDYYYRYFYGKYVSDIRKKMGYTASSISGSYYTGSRVNFDGGIWFRIQPRVKVDLTYIRNEFRFPSDLYSNAYFDLIQSKLEVTFNRKIFWTSFVQYNNQLDNFNINSKIQWRFRPLSDLYIVYTDDYDGQLDEKYRSLVVKFIYWISI